MQDNKTVDPMDAFMMDMTETAIQSAKDDLVSGVTPSTAQHKYNYNKVVSRHPASWELGAFAPFSASELLDMVALGCDINNDPFITGSFMEMAIPPEEEEELSIEDVLEAIGVLLTPEPTEEPTTMGEFVAGLDPEIMEEATDRNAFIKEATGTFGPDEMCLMLGLMDDDMTFEDALGCVHMAVKAKEDMANGASDEEIFATVVETVAGTDS